MQVNKTLFGIDKILNQPIYKTQRIGLVTNNAAFTSEAQLSRIALLKNGFKITKLFSPEHGLTATGPDGVFQKNSKDPVTGLPVISLYGDTLQPDQKDLSDIDCILFDIPDVGSRFYSYLWTLTYLLEASATFNKTLLIADRPNPLGGNPDATEGPMLDEKNCSSFIGRWNIPIRHSCTYGELANYFSDIKKIKTDVTVIKIENWNRNKPAGDEWRFTPTSPAITDLETAMLYPGMGLMEGIHVNEGRGTNTPFKLFGAPWIDAGLLLKEFKKLSLPGIQADEVCFTPETSLYQAESCNGLKFIISDKESFKPVMTGLELIRLIQNLFPGKCEERLYKTVANPSGKNHLDKLTGVQNAFEKIKNGVCRETHYSTGNWKETIKPFLLY